MDFAEALRQNHGKAGDRRLVKLAKEEQHFEELMQVFLHEEYRPVQRAARIVSRVVKRNPKLIRPYLPQIVARLSDEAAPPAIRRNVVRLLQTVEIPKELHEEIMNRCFDYLMNPKEAIAVRAFSMTVLWRLSKIYPEISGELRVLLENELAHQSSAGIVSRAKNTLAKM